MFLMHSLLEDRSDSSLGEWKSEYAYFIYAFGGVYLTCRGLSEWNDSKLKTDMQYKTTDFWHKKPIQLCVQL